MIVVIILKSQGEMKFQVFSRESGDDSPPSAVRIFYGYLMGGDIYDKQNFRFAYPYPKELRRMLFLSSD